LRRLALLTLLSALLLASCGGGDSQTEAEYRTQLNQACRQLAEETDQIRQTVQDQGVDLSQARALAAEAGTRFTKGVDELDPPDSLQDAHQELLDAGDEVSQSTESASAANVRAVAERFIGIYTKLGATDCVQVQREAIARIASG
jgi:ABC-type transporter Mla subunit MlaD